MRDGQDGGYSLWIYPNEEVAKATLAKAWCTTPDKVDWRDEYQNGYFSDINIPLEVDENGKVILTGEFYLGGFGQ